MIYTKHFLLKLLGSFSSCVTLLLTFIFSVSCPHWCQTCVICKQSHGSCTSCCKCATYFHVMCASRMGYSMAVSMMILLLKFKPVLDLKLLLFLLNLLFFLEGSKVIYVHNQYIDFYESKHLVTWQLLPLLGKYADIV